MGGHLKNTLTRALLLALPCALFLCIESSATEKPGWTILQRKPALRARGNDAVFPGQGSLSAMSDNPAAIGMLTRNEIQFITESGLAEDVTGALFQVLPLSRLVLGIGYIYYDAGSAELAWIDQGTLHTRSCALQKDNAGIVSLAYRFRDTVSVGLSLKGAVSEIAETARASAYAADIGFLFQPLPGYSVSIAVQNAGVASKFMEKADPLPLTYHLSNGIKWTSGKRSFSAGAGAEHSAIDNRTTPEAFLETGYGPVSFNAGYSFGSDESSIHTGLLLVLEPFTFGYAYLPGIHLNPVQRLSLSYTFGKTGLPAQAPLDSNTIPIKNSPVVKTRFPAQETMHKGDVVLAVLDLEAKNTSTTDASILSDFLQESLVKHTPYQVIEREKIQIVLKEQQFQISGCTDESIIRIGKLMGADKILIGSLSHLETKYHLSIRIVCIASGKIEFADSISVSSLHDPKSLCLSLIEKLEGRSNMKPKKKNYRDSGSTPWYAK